MKKTFVYMLMTVCFTIGLFVIMDPVTTGAESIQDYENKIQELEKERKELQEKENEVDKDQSEVADKMDKNLDKQDSAEQKMNTIQGKISNTEAKINKTEQAIEETDEKIANLQAEIKELKKDIKALEERIEKREELLKDRLRSLQESGGNVPYISVIFGSKSFSELISRSTAVNSIMDQDESIIKAHFADKRELQNKETAVKDKKSSVEEEKKDQEAQKTNLVGFKTQLDKQKTEQKRIKKELEKEYSKMEEYNLSLDEENKIIANRSGALEKAKKLANEEIARIEQEEKEKREREQAQAQGDSPSGNQGSSGSGSGGTGNVPSGGGNGVFAWPASGSLSSGFGSRPSPGGIGTTTHNGIDIAASRGTAVTAPAAGVVTLVNTGCTEGNYSCGGGYGNYIIVTHYIDGKAYDTLYGHLSFVNVSNGQSVSKGQKIGGVGHTGSSTGPHLHFEIHPGGYKNPVNPMSFLR